MPADGLTASMPRYRVYRFAGRRILAVPDTPRRLRGAGVGCLQPLTAKRWLFNHWLRAAMFTGLDGFISTQESTPLGQTDGFPLEDWKRQCGVTSQSGALDAIVVWPLHPARRRFYVHLLDRVAGRVGFAKLGLDAKGRGGLQAEAATLQELTRQSLTAFRTPTIIHAGPYGNAEQLVLTPLPATAVPVRHDAYAFPGAIVQAFAGPVRQISAEAVQHLPWWPPCVRALAEQAPGLAEHLTRLSRQGLRVCRVHGDFGPANMFLDGTTYWLFDWESSLRDGPVLLDHVSYFLTTLPPRIRNHPRALLRAFWSRFIEGQPEPQRADALVALAFRHWQRQHDAAALLRCWAAAPVAP